jgi:hypothetical protein
MLNLNQISSQIAEVVAARISVDEFEEWFRFESRNFHVCSDRRLKSAIFEVEGVLSEYHFAALDEVSTAQQLAAAIRPACCKGFPYRQKTVT